VRIVEHVADPWVEASTLPPADRRRGEIGVRSDRPPERIRA